MTRVDLTTHEAAVLTYLGGHSQPYHERDVVDDVARRTNVPLATIEQAIAGLHDKGLVQRWHGRRGADRIAAFTPKGRA